MKLKEKSAQLWRKIKKDRSISDCMRIGWWFTDAFARMVVEDSMSLFAFCQAFLLSVRSVFCFPACLGCPELWVFGTLSARSDIFSFGGSSFKTPFYITIYEKRGLILGI